MSQLSSILFVDDEVRVLDGLRDLLRKHRRRWEIQFAPGGEAALGLLAIRTFDVVVTDLRMPVVDGFALLEYLKEHHPTTVRLVLSGDPQRETALKIVPHAHRALIKPCKVGELEMALESACALGQLIADDSLRGMIGKIVDLPPMPQTYNRLVRVLEEEHSTYVDVANVLASDIALSAKVLQIANSSMFGAGRAVSSVSNAIGLLGMHTIRTIVLSEGVLGRRELPPEMRSFSADLHVHSSLVARVAVELTRDSTLQRDLFAAGMLHDVGRLVMALEMSRDRTSTSPRPTADEDRSPEHARIGAYLLGLWGVPASVIQAVANHHGPDDGNLTETTYLVREAEAIVEMYSKDGRVSDDVVEEMLMTARERAPNLAKERRTG